jgi:hypothetical protein
LFCFEKGGFIIDIKDKEDKSNYIKNEKIPPYILFIVYAPPINKITKISTITPCIVVRNGSSFISELINIIPITPTREMIIKIK